MTTFKNEPNIYKPKASPEITELAKKLYGNYTGRRVLGRAFDRRVHELTDLYCDTNRIRPKDIYSTVHDVVKHFEGRYHLHFKQNPHEEYVVSDKEILEKVSDFLEQERQRGISELIP